MTRNCKLSHLSFNQISDISSLQKYGVGKKIDLQHNLISDLTSLKTMPLAKTHDLWYNLISDLTSLQDLSNLEFLFVSNNKISNISPLINGVPKLQILTRYFLNKQEQYRRLSRCI